MFKVVYGWLFSRPILDKRFQNNLLVFLHMHTRIFLRLLPKMNKQTAFTLITVDLNPLSSISVCLINPTNFSIEKSCQYIPEWIDIMSIIRHMELLSVSEKLWGLSKLEKLDFCIFRISKKHSFFFKLLLNAL